MPKPPTVTPEERAEKAPLTGVLNVFDVLRHLVQYGPGGSEPHRAELLAAVDSDDPAVKDEPTVKDEPSTDPAAGRQGGTPA